MLLQPQCIVSLSTEKNRNPRVAGSNPDQASFSLILDCSRNSLRLGGDAVARSYVLGKDT